MSRAITAVRLSTRAVALLGGLLVLAGCGFTPLHGQHYRDTLSVDLSSVRVGVTGSAVTVTGSSIIPRRYIELLKSEIEDSSNPQGLASEKLFALTITFFESDVALFVNPDGTASRGDLVYTSSYGVTRLSDGKPVASGSIRRVSSYNSSPTADFASYVSIEDARKRGIRELAEDYKLRLATLLPVLNNPKASAIEPPPSEKLPVLQPVYDYETLRPRN